MAFCAATAPRVHDTILRCRINAAFRSQVERRIYAAEGVPEEICPAPQRYSRRPSRPWPECFTPEMIVVSHFIINTLLQLGALRGAETQNRFNFNGFYALSKTAEAVKTHPPHSYTPLKQG